MQLDHPVHLVPKSTVESDHRRRLPHRVGDDDGGRGKLQRFRKINDGRLSHPVSEVLDGLFLVLVQRNVPG